MEKLSFKILSIFYTACLLLVLFLLYHYVHDKYQNVEQNQMLQKTQQLVQKVDKTLAQFLSAAYELAHQLDSGQLERAHITNQLDKIMEKSPQIFGIGVAYIPYINTPQERRRSLYYLNTLGPFQTVDEQDIVQLFTIPACFYVEPNTQQTISNCMVFVEYSLQTFKTFIAKIDLGQTGYGFILSKQGEYIVHPLHTHQSIFNLADIQNNPAFKKLGEHAVNSESGTIAYRDRKTGQNNWIFYHALPATGWLMGFVVNTHEIQNIKALQHQEIWLIFWLIVFFILLSTLLFRVYEGEWWSVVVSSIFFLSLGILFMWFLAHTNSEHKNIMMLNKVALHTFLPPSVFVPTQVLITSIDLKKDDTADVIGYIQQKYNKEEHKDYARHITIKGLSLTEVSRHTDHHTEIIKWHFAGTVPQVFDYSKYPFDHREINLQIIHKKAILTPDFEAYPQINPMARPGIKQDLDLVDWNIQRSFFSYSHNIPTLHFTVSFKRNLITPFLNNFLPLFVVSLMLFGILFLLGKVKSIANVIAPLLALFFGTILAHIGLRRENVVWEVLYIEYLYIIIYLAILAVIAFYVLFHSKNTLQYRDGLVAKLLFWPVILGTLFSISLWTFY